MRHVGAALAAQLWLGELHPARTAYWREAPLTAMCKLIILTIHGWLLCGANGMPATDRSFTPGYQLVYDAGWDRQYCVPSDDVNRAMDVWFGDVVNKVRADSTPLPKSGECPR